MKLSGYLADFYKMQSEFLLMSLGPHLCSRQRKHSIYLLQRFHHSAILLLAVAPVHYLSKSMVNKYLILLPTQLRLSPMEPGNEFLLLLKGLRLLNNSEAPLLAVIGCTALNYLKMLFVRN